MNLKNILFIDIETVSEVPHFEQLSSETQQLFIEKNKYFIEHNTFQNPEELYEKRAAIYAEFGKVVCIAIGAITIENGEEKLRIKGISGTDEKQILEEFLDILQQLTQKGKELVFCGHNINEFDIPYLCRRILIHALKIPSVLNFSSKKPWEVNSIDTLHLWRFGDYKNYTSLKLLAHILGIPTSKDDIDGSQVGQVFWKENNLERIRTYCMKDVATVAQLYFRIQGKQLLSNAQIEMK